MMRNKLLKVGILAFLLNSVTLEAKADSSIEPPNLVDKPDYEVGKTCIECEKAQFIGIEPKDSFFTQKHRPSVLEGGVHYKEEDELYVGGKSSFSSTHEEIMEDDVKPEAIP